MVMMDSLAINCACRTVINEMKLLGQTHIEKNSCTARHIRARLSADSSACRATIHRYFLTMILERKRFE